MYFYICHFFIIFSLLYLIKSNLLHMIFTKKKIIISIVSLILLIWGSYYFFFYKNSDSVDSVSPDVFYDVSTWSLLSSINVLWETNLLNEQKLKFNIDGTVKTVYITEWSKVKSGELIAELNKWELENELKDTNIKLENAKLNLDKVLEKFEYEDRIKSEIELENKKNKLDLLVYDIDKAKIDDSEKISLDWSKLEKQLRDLEKQKLDLSIEKSKLDKDFTVQEKDFNFKITNLENDKWKLQTSITDEEKNLTIKINEHNRFLKNTKEQIYTDLTSIEDTLRSINYVLHIDKEYNSNTEKNIYFSAENSTFRNESEVSYWLVKWKMNSLLDKYLSLNSNYSIDSLISLLAIEKDLYTSLYTLWDNVINWANNSVAVVDFTQWEIDSIRSTWVGLRNTSNTSKNTIDDVIEKLENLDSIETITQKSTIEVNRLKNELSLLEPNLEKTKLEFEASKVSLPFKLKELEYLYLTAETEYNKALRDYEEQKYKTNLNTTDKSNELKLAKLDYELSLKEFNKRYKTNNLPDEIILAQNEVKQAEISVDQVNKKIENYEIRAPFDWLVDTISLKVGDNLSTNSAEEKYINLINPNIIEIKIKLDQADIVKVKKWTEANITFDSIPDAAFTWAISFIDSKPTDDNWVKKFLVKMMIDKWELNIFSWMTANVEIIFEKIDDCILVPSMSVELDAEKWTNYVTVLVDWKKEKRTVEIWLTNDSMTQILSWVNVWEQILEVNFAANSFETTDFNGPQYYWP